MATQKLYVSKAAYVKQANSTTYYGASPSTWYDIYGSTSDYEDMRLYMAFESMPDSLKHYSITGATVTMRGRAGHLGGYFFYVGSCTEDFDASTLTYATIPEDIDKTEGARTSLELQLIGSSYGDQDVTSSSTWTTSGLKKFVQAPAHFVYWTGITNDNGYMDVRYGLNAGTNAYITITYDTGTSQTSQITYSSGPKSGYYDPRNATSFSWSYQPVSSSIICADESFEQASATFYWKSSSDANYTSVAISGTTTSVTIAANTFPTAETISWYVEGTDEDGTTSQTSIYSFSTAAGTVTPTCIDPVNQVIDGSADYTFQWTIASEDGQNASRTTMMWRVVGTNAWYTVFSEYDHVTSYTVPGGTFPAGEIEWEILARNIDNTQGPAATATFISVAAPDPVDGLAATAVPFSTISWQSDSQQAYEITIDGTVVKKAYGTSVYSWTVEEPLEDGSHTISVRVQGIYGYWSQPSTITVTISNTPDTTLTLTGTFGTDAGLTWDSSTYTTYVYRDGVRIGETADLDYIDRRALGPHSYYVLQAIGDGNYNKSNTVTGTITVSYKMIAPVDGSSGWLSLKLSENSYDTDGYTWSITNVTQHVLGATYPQLEVSTFEKLSGTYNCAFTSQSDIVAFEALQGKLVILKAKGDVVITGLLSTVNKKVGVFYTSYSFVIQQIDVEDYEEQ